MFSRGGPTLLELLQQALTSTQRGYDLLAPKFDLTPFRTPDQLIEPVMDAVGHVDSAIDLCCGTGAALPFLQEHCAERVVGIDFSAGMLTEARKRLESSSAGPPVTLVQGDVLTMPYVQEFDAATCFGALGHILPSDQDRFLQGIYQALRPGGRFLFITGNHPPPFSTVKVVLTAFNLIMRLRNALLKPSFIMYYLTFLLPEVEQSLRRVGFEVEVQRGLFPAPFARYCLVIATRRS
jgi:ubiquinone/menaquinone biosynthesis C-methylase UbiE